MTAEPDGRTRNINGREANPDGEYVLYWMTSARRPRWNHALDRAAALAGTYQRPLVILEAIRVGYPWASARHHSFMVDGMRATADYLARYPVTYHPYIEPEEGEGRGLLEALAARASVVVTDDFPAFFHPAMTAAAAGRLAVRLEAVDGNGLVPMRLTDRLYPSAYHFRRYLQRVLPDWLDRPPTPDPLAVLAGPSVALPMSITSRWPAADLARPNSTLLRGLPIDHRVGPTDAVGGFTTANRLLDRFVDQRLDSYDGGRNQPSVRVTSELSPYLHFGHIAAQEIVTRVLDQSGWKPETIAAQATGARQGWWGLDSATEAFLDQLITWRELGFNRCLLQPNYDNFDTLPAWARSTLEEHEMDPRPHRYSADEFEAGATHDRLWNAAQTQLVREGVIHNYLRMLWGKKILEWSASPREALATMIELNNRFALDGRDPNSYNGIMWVLGRFDRPWPERAVFGKVRSMTSRNTARKVDVRPYVDRYGDAAALSLL